MNNLTATLERMDAMIADYEKRIKDANERIISIGKDLQAEKDAMNAAATADDAVAYAEHDTRVRYLTARIEASKNVQTAPLFSSPDEAAAICAEYTAAIHAAIRPIYARLKDSMEEQTAMLQELNNISAIAGRNAYRLARHTSAAGRTFIPWTVPRDISKYIESGRYNAQQSIDYVLNK